MEKGVNGIFPSIFSCATAPSYVRQAVLGCLPLALLGKLLLFPMGLGFASSLLSPEALNSP